MSAMFGSLSRSVSSRHKPGAPRTFTEVKVAEEHEVVETVLLSPPPGSGSSSSSSLSSVSDEVPPAGLDPVV
eukprot:s6559_g5.t1